MKLRIFSQRSFNVPFSVQFAKDNAKKHYKSHKGDPNSMFMMYCPYCGAPLESTNRKEKLESLSEHVMCSEPTLKTVYKCSAHCAMSTYSKWNNDGEMYIDIPDDFTKEERDKAYDIHWNIQKQSFNAKYNKWPSEALNTFTYKTSCEIYTPNKKKEWLIRLFKNQKHVPVIVRSYIFDEWGTAKWVKYNIEYRKYSDKSYTSWKPWHVQLINAIKNTRHSYQNYVKYPTERNLKSLYGITHWKKSANDYQSVEKIYYKYVIPFIFGKCMGIVYTEN